MKLSPISSYFATLAQIYFSTKNPSEAYRAASRATELDDKNGEALRLKGDAAAALGNHEEAMSLYTGAIVLSGDNKFMLSAIQSSINQSMARQMAN